MKRIIALIALFVGVSAFAQTPVGTEIPVKSSPAEDSLVQLARKNIDNSKIIQDLLQQARTALDKKNQPIRDEIKTRSAKLQAQIDAATKDLRVKIDANESAAQADFQKNVAGLQGEMAPPQTLKALEAVVKKEQGLPDNALFDPQKQIWVVPVKPAEPVDKPVSMEKK